MVAKGDMTPEQADARITEWVAEKIRKEQMNHITTTHRVIAAESATEVGQDYEDFKNVRTYYFFVGWWAGVICAAFLLWVL